jgi:hypothetical protein
MAAGRTFRSGVIGDQAPTYRASSVRDSLQLFYTILDRNTSPRAQSIRAVAKPAFGARGGDETASNFAEGDCRASVAVTVNRECNGPAQSIRSNALS